MKPSNIIIILVFSVLLTSSCNSDYTNTTKRGYFKIHLPQKKYQVFDGKGYPYTFEYPVYSSVVKDSLFFEEKAENDYWLNLDFPQFDARLHLSYKMIGKNNFDSLVNDAFELSNKQHVYKASSRKEQYFKTPNGVSGMYYMLKGNVATSFQFYATDSVNHFLRGALYINATPNSDSLDPVNNFLQPDVRHLVETLKWR